MHQGTWGRVSWCVLGVTISDSIGMAWVQMPKWTCSEWGCSAQGSRCMCIGFLPKARMMSSEHHRPLCMTSVMSVLERYKRKNAQEGASWPGFQSYKGSSFLECRVFRCVLTLGLTGKLCKQKTKCWFNCFPNSEPLSGQTSVLIPLFVWVIIKRMYPTLQR